MTQVNIPVAGFFVPTLQREDGSYIGTISGGSNNHLTAAIGIDGSIVWMQNASPISGGGANPVTPLYATSDGGVIVTTTQGGILGNLYTLDQHGEVSQTTDAGMNRHGQETGTPILPETYPALSNPH